MKKLVIFGVMISLSGCVTGGINYDPCNDPNFIRKCEKKEVIKWRTTNTPVNLDAPTTVLQ